jgi:hypothetical protein
MILINTGCKADGEREIVKIFKYLGKILRRPTQTSEKQEF